jgi:hypothetical protein
MGKELVASQEGLCYMESVISPCNNCENKVAHEASKFPVRRYYRPTHYSPDIYFTNSLAIRKPAYSTFTPKPYLTSGFRFSGNKCLECGLFDCDTV